MVAVGYGMVESIKDGNYHKCTLHKLNYERSKPIKVNKQIKKKFGIESNDNFSLITLRVDNNDIKIPYYDTLKEALTYYYSLRDIMSSSNRKVILRELDQHNKIKKQDEITYSFPLGEQKVNKTLEIPGYKNAKINLEIYRSNEALSGDEKGPYRENGILIKSKGAILDISLSRKYEGHDYAVRFFGHAVCDYFDHLLREEKEPIIRPDRGGLDDKHNFCKSIDLVLEKEISQLVKEEEKDAKEEQKRLENENTRKRYNAALPKLNQIAKDELDVDEDDFGLGDKLGKSSRLPPNGFDFMPEYIQVIVDKESTLILKGLVPKAVSSGQEITITSDSDKIIIIDDKPIIFNEKDADDNGVVVKIIKVIGRQVGAEGIITAETNKLKAEMMVKVISRREVGPRDKKKQKGLFKDIKFNSKADPNYRVKFDSSAGSIIIATQAPSVKIYFGPEGEGQEEGHCQVMLAELVIEAFCREIARRSVLSGNEPYLGEESAAISVKHDRLVNRYAKQIHNLLVQSKFRRT